MKTFCESLTEYTMKTMNCKKGQQEAYENGKICYICKETYDNRICNLKYSVPKNSNSFS